MCERYQLSDRAGAAIATSTLQDMEIVTNEDKSLVIDPSKLRRERERCRKEICQEEISNFKYVSGLYFDGRKDATKVMLQGPNGKMYRSTKLEEHYVLIGEPGTSSPSSIEQLFPRPTFRETDYTMSACLFSFLRYAVVKHGPVLVFHTTQSTC